jgi:hypothetical protein
MDLNLEGVQTGAHRYLKEWGAVGDDKLGILPSHHSRDLRDASLYQNGDLVRQTASTLLPIARDNLQSLQAKIDGYQEKEKEDAIQTSHDVAAGTAKIRLNIKFDHRSEDPIGDMRRAYEHMGSEEYRQHIRDCDEFSIGLEDMYVRIGLTAVVSGLEIMAETGEVVPEIIGKAFHETYQQSLS